MSVIQQELMLLPLRAPGLRRNLQMEKAKFDADIARLGSSPLIRQKESPGQGSKESLFGVI